MSFKVGDRVRDIVERWDSYGSEGVVVEITNNTRFNVRVRYDGGENIGLYAPTELELITSQYVNVVESRTIWVTLPGDNAGHKLTEDEAQALFRQLEEIL